MEVAVADDTRLRELRNARAQAIDSLSEQCAQDKLPLDEFERRLDLAHRSESVEELQRLAGASPRVENGAALVPAAPPPAVSTEPRGRTLAVLGSVERRGSWTPPRALEARAVLGSVELDFREARFAPGVTELEVSAILGSVEIIVPPWLAVETDGAGILGSFEHLHRAPSAPDPEVPTLRVRGKAVGGVVEVVTRLAKKS